MPKRELRPKSELLREIEAALARGESIDFFTTPREFRAVKYLSCADGLPEREYFLSPLGYTEEDKLIDFLKIDMRARTGRRETISTPR